MNKEVIFKPGDKVKRIAATYMNVKQYETYTVKRHDYDGLFLEGDDHGKYVGRGFELVKSKEIDLTKDLWYIHVPTAEKSLLVQEWLFTKGLKWRNLGQELNYEHWNVLTNGDGGEYLFNATIDNIADKIAKGGQEITYDVITVLDNIQIPDTLSEEKLEIIKLEKEMQQIADRINHLKKVMK